MNIDYSYDDDDNASASSDCTCQSDLLLSDNELVSIIVCGSVTIVVQGISK